jgi:glycosyl transferase family 1
VMMFPSRFEGFGLPLLEAMACGTPIVCSPIASIPEVAGDAALYVDPGDPPALARAALRLLDDDVLRARCTAAGRERVGRFSFTDTARQTLAVFDEVLAGVWRAPELPAVRPPVGDHALQDGHSRWYFHCADLREVRLGVAAPAGTPRTRLTVCLDECVVLETGIEAGRVQTFTITPPSADIDFHRLEVTASAEARLPELTIVDGDGRARRLIG